MNAENYYQILGIGTDADDDAVKQAFREKAKSCHPDRNPGDAEAELRFKLIGTAYDALKDAARRESYNQYLAFNEGREQSERRQWGRLFGIIGLLLIGPSVVFATVYALGGLSFFTGDTEIAQAPVTRPAPPAREEPRPAPEAVVEPKPADPIEAVKRETQRSLLPEQVAPASPPEVALNVPAQRIAPQPAPPPAPAVTPPTPAPQAIIPPPAPQAAAPAPLRLAPPAEQDRTVPPAPATPPAAEDNTGQSSAAIDPFDGPEPVAPPQQSPAQGESDARASARLLAQLKEPGGAGSTADTEVAALPREERRKDTFSDCPTCPLMSATPQSDQRDQALSLAEITVAEWNACARDGACAPVVRNAPPESPVVGLSRGSAAAYADWLSARTGESYRIVMPAAQVREPAVQVNRDCEPERRVTGFEWLEDERPRANPCAPAATANGDERPSGFRVARKLRRQG